MGIGTSIGKAIGRSVISSAVDIGTSTVINKAMSSGFKAPKVDIKMDSGGLKLPYGLDSYISKPVKDVANKLNLSVPTEINGVKLPSMPDLTQVSGKVEGALSSMGLSTKLLGIRDINDILSNPDIVALKNVDFASPINLNNMPDVNTLMNKVDISVIENSVNKVPDIESILNKPSLDVSKFF